MEELRKEKSKVEELKKVHNDLEKNNSRLIKDVTALKEKGQKVVTFFFTVINILTNVLFRSLLLC